MNKITNLYLLICLIFTVQLSAQTLTEVVPESVGLSSERLARLSNAMQAYVDNDQLPGSVVLVARKGKIAYLEAFGQSDLASEKAMDEQTIFRIASQTKAIVSTGVMMLQEEGKLFILDPVGKYLPAFMETKVAEKQSDGTYKIIPAERPINIRDLLTHTAGVGYGYGTARDLWEKAEIQGWYFADRDEPIQATINRMAELPFDAHPGERYIYGYSTDILGALIEVVSGMPLNVFLQEKILDPLGMEDTHFFLPKDKANRLATVYSSIESGIKIADSTNPMQNQGAYIDGPRKSFSGGAGLLSTAKDYAKFLQMMLNDGIYNGERILSRKTVELITTDHLPSGVSNGIPGVGFGLGYSVVNNLGARGMPGSVGEFGWGGAYHSTYWADPEEELLVVYFTQLIPARRIDDHVKLRALVYQAIID
ncbi:MAG: serine hydrolase domain-containing protein [Bacteroidota bacterium]